MLDALIIQFFSATPRRPTAVYLLLIGKKTISVLFAALQHDQLQWLQLYPTLARTDFQAAVARLVAQGALQKTDSGLVLAQPAVQQAAQRELPLPAHYRADWDLEGFGRRLVLAVQAVSEARFGNRRYRPAADDWATQQAVRRWFQDRHGDWSGVIGELTAAFAALPQATADRLASHLIGHGFVGGATAVGLQASLEWCEALGQLAAAIAAHAEWPALQALWGGSHSLLSASNQAACDLAAAGVARPEIQARLRLRESTVNEHLLGATILGWRPPSSLFEPALAAAFDALAQPHEQDYRRLLAAVAGADFFHVRMFQILQLQGRWPHA
ncbi:YpbB family protein [Lacticaseibacillus suihuaensis]